MGYGTESSLFGIVAAVLGIVLISQLYLECGAPGQAQSCNWWRRKGHYWWWWTVVIPVFERIDYIRLKYTA